MTAGNHSYYVYRYEGNLNGLDAAVVLISYPKEAFLNPKALRVFISTDCSLGTQEILNHYVERWSIEVFFRSSKNKLAFDQYQIRSFKGIQRYWLLMSLAHFICSTVQKGSFEEGYSFIQKQLQNERIEYLYQCGVKHVPLEDVLAMVG